MTSFPETVSHSLFQHQLSKWLASDDLAGEEISCGGPVLVYYTWSAVVRLVGCTAQITEATLGTVDGSEMNIQVIGNDSGGHSCSQHAECIICHPLDPP